MDKDTVYHFLKGFLDNDVSNHISAEAARKPEYAGIRFFNDPIVGYAAAEDDYIQSLVRNKEANLDLTQPAEWLPGAKTVISYFLPFTEEIKAENRKGGRPSDIWQQARVNGQECLIKLSQAIAAELEKNGFGAVNPMSDPRMTIFMKFDEHPKSLYTSNWSERHIAYAAGLGTFSLSKGVITEKGMAGRFGSVVTSLPLPLTPRAYKTLTEYCTECGACIQRCPGRAISFEKGKDHKLCNEYLLAVSTPDGAFYGCGKCQCAVPCESAVPVS
ncbi:MAG: 4Fe-4S binding protein [Clostridiales Family XIII bacterium]|jgi:epoxyqueuosine reductase QueG|nr:4Fe-4S binding protein [Clostridiales Family XIII bacterium]